MWKIRLLVNFFLMIWGKWSSWVWIPSFSCCLSNLNPQHGEVWSERPNSTTIDIRHSLKASIDIRHQIGTLLKYSTEFHVKYIMVTIYQSSQTLHQQFFFFVRHWTYTNTSSYPSYISNRQVKHPCLMHLYFEQCFATEEW